ncbi:MAG TPA: hypothetical protein VF221_21925 [Chloroflexota bacterium]
MIRFILLSVAFLVFLAVAVTLIISALLILTMACVVGIPLYLMGRHHFRHMGFKQTTQRPIERLQQLYAEGKIDLFEFERRVAHLIALEP